ncbi:DUF397 domain-containing protein [Streptomyces sp. SR27]|uniref:DUF397 domain-containing protein n=1 Tax=Streptomyces sp. SR27 TaxID=3076630 RepID=UPI00295B2164|nr:DUF397 domain-containing protein [Streptomyces sp. SR27]MDV9186680.1 DUF397 domain-containing protein [Streptomyces sp. SR27]
MTTSELDWFKSSYSGTGGDNCVEVAVSAKAILVRDSKDTHLRPLAVSRDAWAAFATHAADTHL